MILRRLRVESFRTLRDFEAEFSPGLNVVRGPNEAGKSTLQDAIVALLFTDPSKRNQATAALRSWGAETYPVLRADLESSAQKYALVKDFENKRPELTLPDGTRTADRKRVAELLTHCTGAGSEAVYLATACLLQAHWAKVSAGAELQELLQQSLTGGPADTAVGAILRKLDEVTEALERGTKGRTAERNPGEISQTRDKLQQVDTDLHNARTETLARDHATVALQTATDRLTDIEAELQTKIKLRDTVGSRLKLEEESAKKQQQAAEIRARLKSIDDLEAEIRDLQTKLNAGPEVAPDFARQVADWAKKREELTQDLQTVQADISKREQERDSLAQQLSGAQPRLAPDDLARAMSLKTASDEADSQAARHGQAAAECASALSEGKRRVTARRALIAAGIALIAIAAALLAASPLTAAAAALGIVGVLLAVGGFMLRPPAGWLDLPQRIEQERNAEQEATRRAQGSRTELDAILSSAQCQSVEELAAALREQDALRREQENELAGSRSAIATLGDRVGKLHSEIEELKANLAQALQQTGFATLPDLVAHSDAREVLSGKIRRRQAELKGVLGSDTRDALDSKFGQLAVELRGLRDKLDSPELITARLSPEAYQELLTRVADLERERAAQVQTARDAELQIAGLHHDADDVGVLEGQRQDLAKREERLQERLEMWKLTREVLAEAQRVTVESAADAINPRMGALLAQLTGGRYGEVSLDADMKPVVIRPRDAGPVTLDGPDKRDDTSLSCATREQIFLAARLALVDALWPQAGPPLLLDDPLVNFDATRRQAALDALRSAAQTHQIILFTCAYDYDTVADHIIEMPGP